MSPRAKLLAAALTTICLPGLALAIEPLSNKTLSNAYIPGAPPAMARCKPDGSVTVGRIGDKRQASPCPLLTGAEEKQVTTPDPSALVNRALLDATKANTQQSTVILQPLLDNPNSPNGAALENRGDVTVVLPAAISPTQQGGGGPGLNINSGPGGTVLNLHAPGH